MPIKQSLLQQGAEGTCREGISKHHCILGKALHETLHAYGYCHAPTASNTISAPISLSNHLSPCESHPALIALGSSSHTLPPSSSHRHVWHLQPLSAVTRQISSIHPLLSWVRFSLMDSVRIQAALYSISYQGNIFGKRIFWLQNNLPLSPKVKSAWRIAISRNVLCFPSYLTPVLKLLSVTKVDWRGFILLWKILQKGENTSKIMPIKTRFRKLKESIRKRAFNFYTHSSGNPIATLLYRNYIETGILLQHFLNACTSSACSCDCFVRFRCSNRVSIYCCFYLQP